MLTPVEKVKGFLLKREDMYTLNGVNGCKVREAHALVRYGYRTLIGYGGRRSTTASALAAVGKKFNIPVHFHTPTGEHTDEMRHAIELGAKIVQHRPGYLTVVKSRARDQARKYGTVHSLMHAACVQCITKQMVNVVDVGPKRIVVAAGSGVVLAGIVSHLLKTEDKTPVVAVTVGAPVDTDFLTIHARGWQKNVTFVASQHKYHTEVTHRVGDILLDPLYEAKAFEFLHPGDLLWVSGIRRMK